MSRYQRLEIVNQVRDLASCHRFATNQARLLVGYLACNLLHMIRDTAFLGESVKPSMESIIRRLVEVGARVVYHARKWYVHVASAFPLARYYGILFA
ncbi:MAG: transposase [Syntrophobacteraceae bacterium]